MPLRRMLPELFEMVLRSGPLSAHDLLQLALVSHCFFQAVMPVLWEDPHLVYYYKRNVGSGLEILLPEEEKSLYERVLGGEFFMDPDELPEKWSLERFYVYAPWIKKLQVDAYDPFLSRIIAQGALPTFHRLRKLRISMQYPMAFDVIRYPLTPTITSLYIYWHYMSVSPERGVLPALDILQTASLPLEDLTIEVPDKATKICERLEEFITVHSRLRRLKIKWLKHAFEQPFLAAATLPLLQHFAIAVLPDVHNSDLSDLQPSLKYGFQTLLRFDATVPMGMAGKVLACVSSAVLEEIHLKEAGIWETYGPPHTGVETSTSYVGNGLDDLTRFTQLRVVSLTWSQNGVSWNNLQPLRDLPHLRSLHLSGHNLSSMINDERLDFMTKSWPNLQILGINEPREWNHQNPLVLPTRTLQGLVCLGVNCPKLTTISVPVNARMTPPTPSTDRVGPEVQALSLPLSVVDDADVKSVVAFITRTWPNITRSDWRRDLEKDHATREAEGDDGNENESEDGEYTGPFPRITIDALGKRWKRVWEEVERTLGRKMRVNPVESDQWRR